MTDPVRLNPPGLPVTSPDIVLLTGSMVGASSWAPTGGVLRASGFRVHVPDVIAAHGALPPWRSLPSLYAGMLQLDHPPIVVGHSLATILAAAVAGHRPVRGLVFVDGDIPAANGRVIPGRESFRQFLLSLADAEGRLPRWSDWWKGRPQSAAIGIDDFARDAEAFARFEREQPRVAASWFDDALDLVPWAHIPAGYVQTSSFYDHAAEDAERRGWPAVRIKGTHLHPTLKPDETASAIMSVVGKLA